MTDQKPTRELIRDLILGWGPENPEEPGAAQRMADVIIAEVESAIPPPIAPLDRLASAAERTATILEQDYLERRGRGAKLPKVKR